MRKTRLGPNGPEVPSIVQGCMRFNEVSQQQVNRLVETDMELGVNMFDNADIYGGGDGERMCGKAIRELGLAREDVIIQTKCGIDNHMYDFSREHILHAVDASLSRLGMEYVDVLLLHRPDPLGRPEEIALALDELYENGKARHFGVSNMNPMQLELLRRYTQVPLVANQLQFSPVHTGMIDSGVLVNTTFPGSVMRDGSILDYCRLHDIRVQAWSPFQKGHMEGTFLGDPEYARLNALIQKMAQEKGTNENAIVAAWLLRHPADIQVVFGTTSPDHARETCDAVNHPLTHDEWYAIYTAAGHEVP